MLFHVTMTHSADDCPAYDRESLATFIASIDKLDDLAKELNIKVHFILWGAPAHVAYALIEADSVAAIARFVFGLPIRQEFQVTPVQNLHDLSAMSKAMLAQK